MGISVGAADHPAGASQAMMRWRRFAESVCSGSRQSNEGKTASFCLLRGEDRYQGQRTRRSERINKRAVRSASIRRCFMCEGCVYPQVKGAEGYPQRNCSSFSCSLFVSSNILTEKANFFRRQHFGRDGQHFGRQRQLFGRALANGNRSASVLLPCQQPKPNPSGRLTLARTRCL